MAGMEGVLVSIATCLLYATLHSKQITVFVHTWCGLLKINLSLCEDTFARLEKNQSSLMFLRSLIRIFVPIHQPTWWEVGQDILKKDVYERYLLQSNFATLNNREDTATEASTSGVYCTQLMAAWLWAMVVYKLHGVGWCVAYPRLKAMRRPDCGISRSTESHVFFIYIWYRPTSGDSYRRESL